MLGDLEHSERFHDNGYCRRVKIEEVKGFICGLHKGRATMPDEILMDFWKFT